MNDLVPFAIICQEQYDEDSSVYGFNLATLITEEFFLSEVDLADIRIVVFYQDGRETKYFRGRDICHKATDEDLRADLAAVGKSWLERAESDPNWEWEREYPGESGFANARRWIAGDVLPEELEYHAKYTGLRLFNAEELQAFEDQHIR